MRTLTVDLDLVKKYNVPGPRYTSYPPATQFTDKIPHESLIRAIEENGASDRDLSLYFHLPFCQTLCWYCGCTTVITTQQEKSAAYLEYLRKEVDLMVPKIRSGRRVVQFHFGGGTPTFLLPKEIRKLGELMRSRFEFAPDVEGGVEIDPRRIVRDHIRALRDIGCNRASIGVQDNNPEVQKAVHRIQPLELTQQVVDWIREEGFQSLNIDLIYGLPHQSVASFEKTLDEVVSLGPDRFAIFSYAHVPWIKPAQKIFDSLPSAETKLELLKLTIEKLTGCGYVYIGMDHFARADDELAVAQREGTLQRNFQGYSTRGDADIYGFGMSSISQGQDLYWQNRKELDAYYQALEGGILPLARGCLLTQEDRIRRRTIMRLMCDLRLDFGRMSDCLGIDFPSHFARELEGLEDMEADGLIIRTAEGLEVTELGRLLIRNIAMRFDAYLKPGNEGRFSRTI